MPVPEFVLALRQKVGNDPLWLGGVTAVVVRGNEMLLVKRADNGQWSPVSGCIEPNEEPAVTAVRETLEEADVEITPLRLVGIDVMEPVTYANGDVANFLNLTFLCDFVAGEPFAADEENTDAQWFPIDHLPPMSDFYEERIRIALAGDPECHFRL